METQSYLTDRYRLEGYADAFDKMNSILVQARSECAWWPAARCRGILADLQKTIHAMSRRFYREEVPYGVWDVAFDSMVTSLWQILQEEHTEERALNIQVQQARLMIEALHPLLQATVTVDLLTETYA